MEGDENVTTKRGIPFYLSYSDLDMRCLLIKYIYSIPRDKKMSSITIKSITINFKYNTKRKLLTVANEP